VQSSRTQSYGWGTTRLRLPGPMIVIGEPAGVMSVVEHGVGVGTNGIVISAGAGRGWKRVGDHR